MRGSTQVQGSSTRQKEKSICDAYWPAQRGMGRDRRSRACGGSCVEPCAPTWPGKADCPQQECGPGKVSPCSLSLKKRGRLGLISLPSVGGWRCEGKGRKAFLARGSGQHTSMPPTAGGTVSLYLMKRGQEPSSSSTVTKSRINTLHRSSLYNIQPSKFRPALTSFV